MDLYNGIKLAAGGELGIGVGEEEWGSGERDVLEGFVGRTDGLVDLIVSRFGDAPQGSPMPQHDPESDKFLMPEWQGNGRRSRPSDGVIFSGSGAITRLSVRAISSWVELLYKDGQEAYGIRDNPSAPRRRKRNKQSHSHSPERKPEKTSKQHATGLSLPIAGKQSEPPTGIPAPIFGPMRAPSTVPKNPGSASGDAGSGNAKGPDPKPVVEDRSSGTDTLMKYLTLGVYGSKRGIKPIVHRRVSDLREANTHPRGAGLRQANHDSTFPQEQTLSHGYFMIGLQGELDQEVIIEDSDQDNESVTGRENLEDHSWSQRTVLRTLHVQRAKWSAPGSSSSMRTSSTCFSGFVTDQSMSKRASIGVDCDPSMEYIEDRLCVVVYVVSIFRLHSLGPSQTCFQINILPMASNNPSSSPFSSNSKRTHSQFHPSTIPFTTSSGPYSALS